MVKTLHFSTFISKQLIFGRNALIKNFLNLILVHICLFETFNTIIAEVSLIANALNMPSKIVSAKLSLVLVVRPPKQGIQTRQILRVFSL